MSGETTQVIWNCWFEKNYLLAPGSICKWRRISTEFKEQRNFPHCIGAIDGKHVNIQALQEVI